VTFPSGRRRRGALTATERRDPPDLKRAQTVAERPRPACETRRIAPCAPSYPPASTRTGPGITAICRIERIRELKDRCSPPGHLRITSLPLDKLDPAALLQLARDHWAIENRLFHVRDVTFGEDACRVRSGAAPRALADIRSAALDPHRAFRPEKPRPPAKPSPRENGPPSASS